MDAEEIKKEPFFKSIDWTAMAKREIEPPIKPTVKSDDDYSNFDKMFLSEEVVDTPVEKAFSKVDKYEGFTYARTDII